MEKLQKGLSHLHADPDTAAEIAALDAEIAALEAELAQPLPTSPPRTGTYQVRLPDGRWLSRPRGTWCIGRIGVPTSDRTLAHTWRRLADAQGAAAGWLDAVVIDTATDQIVRDLTPAERAYRRTYPQRVARLAELRARRRQIMRPAPRARRYYVIAGAEGFLGRRRDEWGPLEDARIYRRRADAEYQALRVQGYVCDAVTGMPVPED